MCVCAYVWSQKNTMDYGSTCLLRQHLGYDSGDRRTFSARIWIRQIYMHPYIHTYMHTYLPTYIPTYLHTYIPTYVHTYIHPPEHTVSSGYSGVHLGPFTVLPAQDAVECAWARAHARQNARYDPKLNVRIYVR